MINKVLIDTEKALAAISRIVVLMGLMIVVLLGIIISLSVSTNGNKTSSTQPNPDNTGLSLTKSQPKVALANTRKAPDLTTIPTGKAGEQIRYGRELLVNTARYFGPRGSLAQITNGMNCQNCHLDAGTRLFANNYIGFISGYPKLSARSGKVEPPAARIAECFRRSLAGQVPDTAGKEVQAILAYMKWVGRGISKGRKPYGSGTEKLAFMDHAADPVKGKVVFIGKCQSCHGNNGEGLLAADKKTYTFPPLWGKHSYNDGAGMYRISNLAGFVKNNMPYGVTYQNPQLTDEEAWNVAAYINSQHRPHKDQSNDWVDLSKKPIDAPFGPYADRFSEAQHKYGPFKPIKDAQKNNPPKS